MQRYVIVDSIDYLLIHDSPKSRSLILSETPQSNKAKIWDLDLGLCRGLKAISIKAKSEVHNLSLDLALLILLISIGILIVAT